MRSVVAIGALVAVSRFPAPLAGQSPDTVRLGLVDAIRMAAERSAGVELSRITEREGTASVSEERASLLPHLSAEASHGNRTFNTASFGIDFPTQPGQPPLFDPNGQVLGPVTTAAFRAHVSQTLFDWTAIKRVSTARATLDADRAATEVARERAAAVGAAAFVQAERARARLAARVEDVSLAQDLLGVARDLLDAGMGVRLDVTRAEAQLATMRAELVTARAEAARMDLALLRALNLPLDTHLRLDSLESAAPPPSPANDPVQAAIARRPDVTELDLRIAAARRDVAEVRAERLPTVSFTAGEGITGSAYDHLLNTYEWSLRVSVPVFDGRSRRAREASRRARADALDVRRTELARQVAFDVRDATLRVQAATELVAASGARLDLASAELDQARERFSAGVAGSADVVTASLRLNEARTAAVDARAALDAARVTLAIADGSLLELR